MFAKIHWMIFSCYPMFAMEINEKHSAIPEYEEKDFFPPTSFGFCTFISFLEFSFPQSPVNTLVRYFSHFPHFFPPCNVPSREVQPIAMVAKKHLQTVVPNFSYLLPMTTFRGAQIT